MLLWGVTEQRASVSMQALRLALMLVHTTRTDIQSSSVTDVNNLGIWFVPCRQHNTYSSQDKTP